MKIKDNSAAFLRKADRRIQDKLEVAASIVEGQAILLAPVDTGYLKGSIGKRVTRKSAFVGASAEYAPHVEMGTSRMAAQPFLVPALELSKAKIEKLFKS